MFTQKKKNYQTFLYVAVVVTLCFLVLALLWPQDAPEEPSADLSSTSLRSEDQDKPDEPDSLMYTLRMKTRRRALMESQTRNCKIHRTVPIKKITCREALTHII